MLWIRIERRPAAASALNFSVALTGCCYVCGIRRLAASLGYVTILDCIVALRYLVLGSKLNSKLGSIVASR